VNRCGPVEGCDEGDVVEEDDVEDGGLVEEVVEGRAAETSLLSCDPLVVFDEEVFDPVGGGVEPGSGCSDRGGIR
jgi:hypothetical protein